MPKLSVCVPVYNTEEFIKQSIESVLAQTYGDFELIVCDDGSTDNTQAIIRSYKDPRIRIVVNERKLGIGGIFNKLIDLTSTDTVAIFHADDEMLPQNLAAKMRFLELHPEVGFVHSNFHVIDEQGKIIAGNWAKNSDHDCVMDKLYSFERLILEDCFICCPSVIIRKECHRKSGYYDPQYHYALDIEMWLRVLMDYDIGYLAEPLMNYRWHAANTTRSFQGNNRLKGYDEEYHIKIEAIRRYQRRYGKIDFDKNLLTKLTTNMGKFFFWQNNFKDARESFAIALRWGQFDVKIFFRWLSTFLPAGLIQRIKQFKNKKSRPK